MKMRHLSNAKWLLAGLLLAACAQDDSVIDNSDKQNDKEGVTAAVEGFKIDNATRTTLELDDTYGLAFKWSENDQPAVFGTNTKTQSTMNIKAGTGTEGIATFDCGDFQLVTTNSYCAYLPFSSAATTTDGEVKIPVSYTGQKQTGNASTAHLGSYDYLASDVVTPSSLNTCHFTFKHMGSAVRLKITMPEAGNWQTVTLAADGGEAFTTSAYLNLFNSEYGCTKLQDNEKASSVTLNLSDGTNNYIATTADDNVLTAWIMLAPTTYFNATDAKAMTVTVTSASGESYTASITPSKEFKRGYAYSFNVSGLEKEKSPFLNSKFKVGDNTYVTFVTGNLQYDIQNSKYQLAENQWTYCVNANGTYTLSSDKKYITATPYTNTNILDLFGWGTANAPTYAYVNLSSAGYALNAGNYYLGAYDEVGNPKEDIETDLTAFNTNNDWGTIAAKQISGITGARTLTAQEWAYLLKNQYCAVANLTDKNVLGLVVFPYGVDETTAKSYLTTASPTVYKMSGSNVTITTTVTKQSITSEKLAASGALFLPAGGSQMNGKATNVKSYGYYWSASSAQTYGESAYMLQFLYNQIKLNDYTQRRHGCSVRLAKYVTE